MVHVYKIKYYYIITLFIPSVVPNDIILFGSRVLHFGLTNDNTSSLDDKKCWNTVLCFNWTKSWFVDPSKKNMWNDDANPSLFCGP